ncbi:MAG: sulfite exporter TauE/SafE family protein [Saprospiraceae bacterium]|nr:MAG: sulfite exporter TauE/SafE family protein [Saprospiraceae bacterium]
MADWELYFLFFLIALLYSSVGFGGGSSYLAILALFGVDYLLTHSTALFCNIAVVSGSVYIFHKKGHLDLKKTLPLVAASVPLAFVGGYLPIRENAFFILLGFTLLIAGILTWLKPQIEKLPQNPSGPKSKFQNPVIGGGIGLLSGMVGIGGGIFLAPVLYLTRWAQPKTIAATSSLFILVNSIAGLGGQLAKPDFEIDLKFVLPLLACVILGGQIGVRIAVNHFPAIWVRRATALLIMYVGVRLLLKYV